MIHKLFSKIKPEHLLIAFLLLVSAVAHGYNMLHFPYFENDEGSYSSYAWALMEKGELSPYTYWYDHSPAGWMLIALWTFITGGFFTFGFSLNSGRILMLVLHVFSSLFLYLIAKKMTNSKWVGILSVIIFSLSPLGIYYQRRILLDNIMIFWSFLSLVFLFYNNHKLRNIIYSAICFGISVLSKETAIFFLPAYLYIVYITTHTKQKIMASVKWLIISGMVISLYFLYALINNELFPSGTFLGGNSEHVSLIGTLQFQANRPGGDLFNPANSEFWTNMRVWIEDDPFIMIFGAVTTVINLIAGIRFMPARIVSLLTVCMWAFLMRGGTVLELYIIPLIPFLALNIATSFWLFQKSIFALTKRITIRRLSYIPYIALLILVVTTSLYNATNVKKNLNLFTSDQTTPQIEAVEWILSRERPDAFYVIDNYALIDLWLKNNNNFNRADWYWKVDKDPDVSKDILNDSPKNIDYIALTPQMDHDITAVDLLINREALGNSKPVQRFWNDGWGVEMWATQFPNRILESSWESYKRNFMDDGRVYDPHQNNLTTSEGQSYAMLRAVWMNDKRTFDEVYTWSNNNLWQENGLYAWKWQNGRIIDPGFAPDADQDIALALLFAYKQWKDPKYLNEGKNLLDAIWQESVVTINKKPYLTAGPWANKTNEIIVNPSYLSPASYKIFAKADKNNRWIQLSDTSYEVLGKCTEATLDGKKGVLPPEWCAIDKRTLRAKQPGVTEPRATEYGYNAFRVPYRVALDYQWHKDKKALSYLQSLSVLNDEWEKDQMITAVYEHDGNVWEAYETAAIYGGNLAYFSVLHQEAAHEIYDKKILNKFYEDAEKSYWEDPRSYYTQNWAWFGTALYTNNLPDLWSKKEIKKSHAQNFIIKP